MIFIVPVLIGTGIGAAGAAFRAITHTPAPRSEAAFSYEIKVKAHNYDKRRRDWVWQNQAALVVAGDAACNWLADSHGFDSYMAAI